MGDMFLLGPWVFVLLIPVGLALIAASKLRLHRFDDGTRGLHRKVDPDRLHRLEIEAGLIPPDRPNGKRPVGPPPKPSDAARSARPAWARALVTSPSATGHWIVMDGEGKVLDPFARETP